MVSSIVNKIAKEKKLDPRVVDVIVGYPIKFLKEKVASDDIRPVMIRYLGKFVQKRGMSKIKRAVDNIGFLKRNGYDDIESLERLLLERKYNAVYDIYREFVRNNYKKFTLSK